MKSFSYVNSRDDEDNQEKVSAPDQLLQMYRNRAGFTQTELGQLVGLSKRMVLNWEAGSNLPRPETLKKLLEIYATRKVFLRGQELAEAEVLWEAVKDSFDRRASFNNLYTPFDKAWFTDLLVQLATENTAQAATKINASANTLAVPLHNLPEPATSFIGREGEINQLKTLLHKTRLLTLTGAGGVGKTRLALEVARQLLGEFKDGVWLVELAALSDPTLIEQEIARILEVKKISAEPLRTVLTGYLRTKELLLVVDNCEHLVVECAALVDTILSACPTIKVLATSREGLNIGAETARRVPSLSLPNPQQLPSLEKLSEYEALQLFVERAGASQPDFKLTDQNAPSVAQICQQLDGIPLALELAAARVKAMSVEQIAVRLDNRFRLLTGGSRAALPRYQTLRASIDWSYNLLPVSEQTLLQRLSVFAGGWLLEAAEAVCTGDGIAEDEVLDLLFQVVNKSMVIADQKEGSIRYHLLETIQQYADEKLQESGKREEIKARHLAYFLAQAEEIAPKLTGAGQEVWLNYLATNYDNFRAALNQSYEQAKFAELARLIIALQWFWVVRMYNGELRKWLQIGLEVSSALPAALRAEVMRLSGYFEMSLTLWRELNNQSKIAQTLESLAFALGNAGDYDASHSYFVEALAIYRAIGDKFGQAFTLQDFGGLAIRQNDLVLATQLLEEGLAINQGVGDNYIGGHIYELLGDVAYKQGNYEYALSLHKKALPILLEIKQMFSVAHVFKNLARLAFAQSDWVRAVRLREFCEKLLDEYGYIYLPLVTDFDFKSEAVRDKMEKQDFEAASTAGRAMTLEEAVIYALDDEPI